MGGSNSKKSAAPVVVCPSCAPVVPGCYIVRLEGGAGVKSLGVEVEVLGPEKKLLFVKTLSEEGLIPTWNANVHSAEKVRVGDVIYQVSGVDGDTNLMFEKMEEASLTLVMKHDDPQSITPSVDKVVEPPQEDAVVSSPDVNVAPVAPQDANNSSVPEEVAPVEAKGLMAEETVAKSGEEEALPIIESVEQKNTCSLIC